MCYCQLMSSKYHMEHAKAFWQLIWTWNRVLQNSCFCCCLASWSAGTVGKTPENHNCFVRLLQVVTCGFTRMTRIQNDRLLRGRVCQLCTQRRPGKVIPFWSACGFLSFKMLGFVHQKFVPQGQTVSQYLYTNILWCVWGDTWWIIQKWCSRSEFISHNNVPAHYMLLLH